MQHILFGSDISTVQAAILIKKTAFNRSKISRYYIEPHSTLTGEDFIGFDLDYDTPKKCKAITAKACLSELLPEIDTLGINTLFVCDAVYFKILTKEKKAEPHYGYVLPCVVKGYEHMSIVLCPNYQALLYNPTLQSKVDRAIATLSEHLKGAYTEPGKDIIHKAYYPDTLKDIKSTLEFLMSCDELTCDIEAKSLEFWNTGISSISFAWDKHNGCAFGVERGHINDDFIWRDTEVVLEIKRLLKGFFEDYTGKLTWHNCGFDSKVLVYELWMNQLNDYRGMIEGIKVMTKSFDDTKLIAYLATNNAVQNVLGLKALSAEFTGNYAEDITDTTKIPLPDLLRYNLMDCLATWYVKEKYEPVMIADQQQDLYEGLFKDTVRTLMQTELCGMPISPVKVQYAKGVLKAIEKKCLDYFANSVLIQDFHKEQLVIAAETKTRAAAAAAKTSRATKVYAPTDSVIHYDFNPGSDTQLRKFLYMHLGYPVVDLTKGKQPSCSGKTIKKLKANATVPEHLEIFEHLIELADVSIILSTFIPAFENAQQLPDGSWRLYGNFNLGGTVSGRLSSSQPVK